MTFDMTYSEVAMSPELNKTLIQWLVGDENHRQFLQVPIVHHLEEYVGSVRTVGQIADLNDYQNVRVGIVRERLLEVSSPASIGEILDEFRRGGEERHEAVLDGSVAPTLIQARSARLGLFFDYPPLLPTNDWCAA